MRKRKPGREDWPKNMYQRDKRGPWFFWLNPFTKRTVSLGRDLDSAKVRAEEENLSLAHQYERRAKASAEANDPSLLTLGEIARRAIDPDLAWHGIYFLLLGRVVVYVGQSNNVGGRLREHRRDKVKEFDGFTFLQCSPAEATTLEQKYIKALKPKYNYISNPARDRTRGRKRFARDICRDMCAPTQSSLSIDD